MSEVTATPTVLETVKEGKTKIDNPPPLEELKKRKTSAAPVTPLPVPEVRVEVKVVEPKYAYALFGYDTDEGSVELVKLVPCAEVEKFLSPPGPTYRGNLPDKVFAWCEEDIALRIAADPSCEMALRQGQRSLAFGERTVDAAQAGVLHVAELTDYHDDDSADDERENDDDHDDDEERPERLDKSFSYVAYRWALVRIEIGKPIRLDLIDVLDR